MQSQEPCRVCSQGVSRKLGGMGSLVASRWLGQVAFKVGATVQEGGMLCFSTLAEYSFPRQLSLARSSGSRLLLPDLLVSLLTCVWAHSFPQSGGTRPYSYTLHLQSLMLWAGTSEPRVSMGKSFSAQVRVVPEDMWGSLWLHA